MSYDEDEIPVVTYDYYLSKETGITFFSFFSDGELSSDKKATIGESFSQFIETGKKLSQFELVRVKGNKHYHVCIKTVNYNFMNIELFDRILNDSITGDIRIAKRHVATFYGIMITSQVKPVGNNGVKKIVRTTSSVFFKTLDWLGKYTGISKDSITDSIRYLVNGKIISIVVLGKISDGKPTYHYFITDCYHESQLVDQVFFHFRSYGNFKIIEVSKNIGRLVSKDYPWKNLKLAGNEKPNLHKYKNTMIAKKIIEDISRQKAAKQKSKLKVTA
ncbi:hypothetical protein [Enterococcus devriesei]|uniref:hypothetical protein n=1 Tax=Enterococcus devriesei TaxID=319970 RepID=UPI0036D2C1EF